MSKTKTLLGAVALLMGVFLAAPANAQQGDPVLAQARAAGIVGEQSDGYVGVREAAAANDDIQRRVRDLNTRRRAAFTRSSVEANPPATVDQLAAAFACEALATRVGAGEYYRVDGQWRQRTPGAPVQLPAVCGA